MRIAVGCQSRVGKDTFAEIYLNKYEAKSFRFSTKLYEITENIQSILNKEVEKDPQLLQTIGRSLQKHYSADVFARPVVDDIKQFISEYPEKNIIVTDLRFPHEYTMLKELGFLFIRIIKNNRIIDRNPNDESENSLLDYDFDFEIYNNLTLEAFHDSVKSLITSRLFINKCKSICSQKKN